MVSKWLEFLLTFGLIDDERVLIDLFDNSSIDELAHQIGSSLAIGLLGLKLLNTLLELIEHGKLLLILLGLQKSRFLLLRDLSLRSAPLAAHFEHIG